MPLRTIIIKATRSGTASTVIIRRGASGTGGGDHGALTGLGDDDHPQYHNNARGDARYITINGNAGTPSAIVLTNATGNASALSVNFAVTSLYANDAGMAGGVARSGITTALLSDPLPILSGGTGAASESAARTALGAGLSGGLLFQTATAQESRALINTSIPSRAVLIESDCFTPTTPGAGTMASGSISGGACINGITTVNNPGVIRFRDAATTANSGFRIQTLTDAFVVGGGEIMSAIFSIPNARTTQTIRFGLSDQIDHTTPTKGAWLEIVGNGTNLVITGKTVNGGAISSTDTTYTAGINTWYSVRIHLTSASSVAFTVYNAAGSILWTNALSTAVPTTAVGFGIIGYDSSSDIATILLEIDYYSFEINRALIR